MPLLDKPFRWYCTLPQTLWTRAPHFGSTDLLKGKTPPGLDRFPAFASPGLAPESKHTPESDLDPTSAWRSMQLASLPLPLPPSILYLTLQPKTFGRFSNSVTPYTVGVFKVRYRTFHSPSSLTR